MRSIETWLEHYFKTCIAKGKLSKRCNNYSMYLDVMDTYKNYINDESHDWNENIYFIPIFDVMSRYVYKEVETHQFRFIKWLHNKIYFSKKSPWFGRYYDRYIKRYVKLSISCKNRTSFDKKYKNYIEE